MENLNLFLARVLERDSDSSRYTRMFICDADSMKKNVEKVIKQYNDGLEKPLILKDINGYYWVYSNGIFDVCIEIEKIRLDRLYSLN